LSMKVTLIQVLLLSSILVGVAARPAEASSAAAKVTTSGMAILNGAGAPALTTVFPGDHITTQAKSATTLSFSGGNAVVIPERTSVTLGEQSGHPVINLEAGSLSVWNKSGTRLVIMAHGARIAAVNTALYDVTLHGNMLRVVARSGEARVETANKSGNVEAGNALSATLAQAPVQPAGSNSMFTTTDWVITGVVAAAATGLGVGIYEAEKGKSASPSVP
jgi:FecR protein